jgi:hypothetical protein
MQKKCLAPSNTRLPETLPHAHQNRHFDALPSSFHPFFRLSARWHGPCNIPFEPDESSFTNQANQPLGEPS